MLFTAASLSTFSAAKPQTCQVVYNPDPLSESYISYLFQLEEQHNLPKGLLFTVMLKESSADPTAVSAVGAQGLFQFMPKTAKWLEIDALDPYQAGSGAARYLRYLIDHFDGNLELGLAAYNAGMGTVKKHGNTIPPFEETQQYVMQILQRMSS